MDQFFSEKSLYGTGRIEEAIEDLKSKDLIYWGALKPPKGKLPDDWAPREQWLFKSTELGDDEDRAVEYGDGEWTYFAPDIAYHFDKVSRGFDGLVDVFGADHTGYVKRMKAAVAALSNNSVTLDIKLAQIVRLFKDGAEFKMSKRAGTFITVQDLVDEVGKDVARFIMLMRKNDTPFDFDFDKVTEQSKDNPVFYVQYAHARVHSVLRKATNAGVDLSNLAAADMALAASDPENALAAKMAEWPRVVEVAARSNEPHRVAQYLYDLASEVHSLWNRGNDDMSLRFLQDDNVPASQAKIALIRAASVVISHGLGILGVTPAEEMR
jgi:arginyl-tRNA synthetase